MSAKEQILKAIAANQPALKAAPEVSLTKVTVYEDPVSKFIATLEGIGGKVERGKRLEEVQSYLQQLSAEGKMVMDLVDTPAAAEKSGTTKTAEELKDIHIALLRAEWGVAENGSVWIPESAMGNRLIPFICQHLLLVLPADRILSTMHHAYEKINGFEEGFGVFLAGPSKTADIEQSLVIGAHGARSLVVYLLD